MLVNEILPVKGYKTKKRYKVRLDNGTDFCLYKRELDRYDIAEGEELPQEIYQRLLTEIFIPRARERCLHLLEKQDRTRQSLITKLTESGYPPEAIEKAIDFVSKYNYINDLRYAQNYIRYHSQNKSKRRVINDLIKKGISKEDIENAIQALAEFGDVDKEHSGEGGFCDISLIEDFVSKKIQKLPDFFGDRTEERKYYSKLYNQLMRKGFDYQDISSVLRKYFDI